jgi:hypothetical protein
MNSQEEDLDDEYMENEENMGNYEDMDNYEDIDIMNDENMNDEEMNKYKTEILDAYHEFVNKINKAKNDITELRDQGQLDDESKDIQNIQSKINYLEERKSDLEREYYERFDELLPGTEETGGKGKKSRKNKKANRKSTYVVDISKKNKKYTRKSKANKKGGKKSKRRSTRKQRRRRRTLRK